MKIVVTSQNVTKLSETVLVATLNQLQEDSGIHLLIEAELERRATIADVSKRVKLEKQQKEALELSELKSEISALFETLYNGKKQALIEKLGDQFAGNYEFNETNFSIQFNLHNINPNSPNYWQFENKERALTHLRNLIYYRIYDHYMRLPTQDTVVLLLSILKG